MFYVEFPSVDKWEKEKRRRYEELIDKTGLRPDSIIPVNDGMIRAWKMEGDISYIRYADLFRQLPTYRGFLYNQLGHAGSTVEMDLCLENGLLLMPRAKVRLLLDPRELTEVEGGGYLLVCEWERNFIQVIVSVEGSFLNLIK